jgi:rhodanese-related sulfurtransferase
MTATWTALSPAEAVPMLQSRLLRVVDVRQPEEFVDALGHVPGAELVPLAALPASLQGWDRDEPLLLVCRSGKRSAAACDLLARAGFRRVHDLTGGMLRWNTERRAVCHTSHASRCSEVSP